MIYKHLPTITASNYSQMLPKTVPLKCEDIGDISKKKIFERNGSFSKLDEHRSDHFLVSSWADGKKLNTLRYYYKMNDAKKYLGLIASDGLAEILSEGDYDDFFLEE